MSFWASIPAILSGAAEVVKAWRKSGDKRPAGPEDANAARVGGASGAAAHAASKQQFSRTYPLHGDEVVLPSETGVISCRDSVTGEWEPLEWANKRWNNHQTLLRTNALHMYFTHWRRW
jgi:hypothetical protein